MDLATVDLLLRAAAFALALAAALAILVQSPRSLTARYAAAVVAGIAAFMAASAPGVHEALGLGAFFFNAWCLATPAFIWLLSTRIFRDDPPASRWRLAVPVMLVSLTMLGDYGRFRLGLGADYPEASRMLFLAGRAAAIALIAIACWHALRHWRADLVEQRRLARAGFVAICGAVFIAAAASEFLFGGAGASLGFLVVAHSLLVALAFGSVLFVAAGGARTLLAVSDPAKARAPLAVIRASGSEAALAERVMAQMKERELWKRDGLGIGALARELGAHEYRVRRAINHHLGYRNFNDFLHDFRLRAAAARLADPTQDHLPVLTIALDCGYGSIGPFNRAFKVRFGVTPSQYRNLRTAEAAVSESGQVSR